MPSSEQGTLLKHIGLVLLWTVVVYVLLVVASRIIVPPFKGDILDTQRAWETPYSTSQKLAYYGRSALQGDRDRVIFIGASNTQLGVSASLAGEALPDYDVHNMSVVSANATVLRQLADIAVGEIGPQHLDGDIFVFGVWYGVFVSDAYRWNTQEGDLPRTLLDEEAMRFGFTTPRASGGYFDRVPDEYLGVGQIVAYPLIAMDRIVRVLTGTKTFPDESYMDTVELTEERREGNIQVRQEEMGGLPLDQDQFDKLDKMIDYLIALDAKVMVVNLPIPRWHKDVSPYYDDYSNLIAMRMAQHEGNPAFDYFDMSDLDDETWFYDDAHLRPAYRHKWIERLAPEIEAFATSSTEVSELERRTDVRPVQ